MDEFRKGLVAADGALGRTSQQHVLSTAPYQAAVVAALRLPAKDHHRSESSLI
ncbi:MAG: hypothetical protein HY866_20375 [Chloroflexi bacterium]|nr:hypothetical protein [Chloroflexota bacterium]